MQNMRQVDHFWFDYVYDYESGYQSESEWESGRETGVWLRYSPPGDLNVTLSAMPLIFINEQLAAVAMNGARFINLCIYRQCVKVNETLPQPSCSCCSYELCLPRGKLCL